MLPDVLLRRPLPQTWSLKPYCYKAVILIVGVDLGEGVALHGDIQQYLKIIFFLIVTTIKKLGKARYWHLVGSGCY